MTAKNDLFLPRRGELDIVSNAIDLALAVEKRQVELIIHLAHPRLYNLPETLPESLLMLRNVLEVCRVKNVRLLYLSSLSIYTGYEAPLVVSSKTEPLPAGVYGQTKFLCEELISVYKKLNNVKATVLRPGYVYGPGMDKDRALAKFINKAMAGEEIILHKYKNGFPAYDFLFVGDLIKAVSSAVDANFSTSLNLGTGVGTSTYEAVGLILSATNSKSIVKVLNVSSNAPSLIVDPSEARNTMSWSTEWSLTRGLSACLNDSSVSRHSPGER